jgi:hypothetical protein
VDIVCRKSQKPNVPNANARKKYAYKISEEDCDEALRAMALKNLRYQVIIWVPWFNKERKIDEW